MVRENKIYCMLLIPHRMMHSNNSGGENPKIATVFFHYFLSYMNGWTDGCLMLVQFLQHRCNYVEVSAFFHCGKLRYIDWMTMNVYDAYDASNYVEGVYIYDLTKLYPCNPDH